MSLPVSSRDGAALAGLRVRRCAWRGRRDRPCRPAQPTACTGPRAGTGPGACPPRAVQISFTGTPGICLAICTALRDVVLDAAPAEAAAEMDTCRPRTWRRQARGAGSSGERAIAVLRGDPYLASCRPLPSPRSSSAPCRRGSGRARSRRPRASWRRRDRAPASPTWLPMDTPSLASRPSFRKAMTDALETLSLGPSSHLMSSALSP